MDIVVLILTIYSMD